MEEKKTMQEIWKKLLNEASLIFQEKTGKKIEIADFFENDTIDTLLG